LVLAAWWAKEGSLGGSKEKRREAMKKKSDAGLKLEVAGLGVDRLRQDLRWGGPPDLVVYRNKHSLQGC
jgi:hypothetical protein